MSNSNFYYNFCEGATFQNPRMHVPPPPYPPQHVHPTPVQPWSSDISDKAILIQFENKITNIQPIKLQNSISISKVHDQIRKIALALNKINLKQKLLSEKINELSDAEWSVHLKEIEENKADISQILLNVNNLNIDSVRKLLAKRSSKRARQKRQRIEKSKQKEELKKQNEEKSRKIDEYLAKFQDNMRINKQEVEAKLQADAVLKETIRKKQDAMKYLVKLDALVKLRKARMNTAKGRGESSSQKEAEVFEININKLKSMWSHRLLIYKKEESELREQLQQDSEEMTKADETEKEVRDNLQGWKDVLFGGMLPQVDFAGDVDRFLAVRCQWDQYLNAEGSSIPIGWVPPTADTSRKAAHIAWA